MRHKRSLQEMDALGPNEWDGDFSDGKSYECAGCGGLIARDLPVVILVDDEVDLETYYHPSCYVLSHPSTELTELLYYPERQEV